ncbi:multiple sugar transport system substrate-binding protein [Deinobacterium chartae]|uniref:Multiple sugar transport system substrate-binding protein n=1 Tax=Deinobacterium chartae TaxID=521158 RepID=A0A841I5B1_9DEIO|nr:ABC transporter substrate-binding protein [Deinobacterium chartae]MBB6099065.1 multiple sugar transport system substrate-binding protein [Deinobacterium chartae]
MRRKTTLALTTLMLLGLPAHAQKVTLELWAHWGSEQRRPTINKIIDGWNKRNPNVQVKYTFVPFDQVKTKVLAATAAGNPPDVAVMDIRTTRMRADKKQVIDLSALGADSLKSRFYANMWETGTYGGKQYSLPFVTETRFLYYNKAAFKEVGLDPNKPPTTWKQLEEYAAKLDKKQGNSYARIGFYPLYGSFGFEGWVNNAGATMWDERMENPRIDNATAVKTLEWIQSFAKRYGSRNLAAFQSSFGGGTQDPFISGRLAMYLDIGGYAATLAKYAPDMDYGIARIPTPTGKPGPMSSWGAGFVLELPAGGKHPKEAYAFAKYMATEGARIWALEQNDFPGDKAAAKAVRTEAFKKMSDNMRYTYISVAPTYAPDYDSVVKRAIDDAINSGGDAKAALGKAQEAIARTVAQNRR